MMRMRRNEGNGQAKAVRDAQNLSVVSAEENFEMSSEFAKAQRAKCPREGVIPNTLGVFRILRRFAINVINLHSFHLKVQMSMNQLYTTISQILSSSITRSWIT